MADGWGDDDLLEDIIADENEDAEVLGEQETDGWGDDDLDLDDIDVAAPTPAPKPTSTHAPVPAPMPVRAAAPVPAPMPVSERIKHDGWNDDLEELSGSLSDIDTAPTPTPAPAQVPMMGQPAPVPAPMPVRAAAPVPAPMPISERIEDDGWNDDLEGLSENLSDIDTAPTPTPAPAQVPRMRQPAPVPAPIPLGSPSPAPTVVSERTEENGWNDDLDGLSEDLNDSAPAPTPAPGPIPMMRQPAPAPAPMPTRSRPPAPMFVSERTEKDGWNDDFDGLNENLSDIAPDPTTPAPAIKSDGWDDDLDDLSAEETGDTTPMPSPVPAPTPMGTTVPASPPVSVLAPAPAPVSGTGWEDELEVLDVEDDEMVERITEPASAAAPSTADTEEFLDADDEMDWGDDEGLFSDAMENTEPPRTAAPTPRTPPQHRQKLDDVHQELVEYVEALMVQLPSVNAVLEAEYNTPEKAHELFSYYSERPQLRQYTIEKEVDRMDYRVVLEHKDHAHEPIVVDNKEEITRMFKLQSDMDMLVRCSNQSLLADLLQVMTGSDRMVRPQYMATCLAQSCLFVLRPRQGTEGGFVECTSQLALSLPEPSGERYPVANLEVHVVFGIPANPQREQPTIQFKLQNMSIVLPSMDVLRPTAQFLLESGLLDHPSMSPFPESPAGVPINNSGDFRDVFLQQSQNMLQSSTVGLKSAWKQIDAVAGFGSKMNMMKRILPTGENSVLEEAMREQEAYQRQMQSQRGDGGTPMTPETVPVSYPPSMKPSQQQQQQQALPQQRPTSILGSVWGRLAKTVTLPEEDTSIYQDYTAAGTNRGSASHQIAQNVPPVQEPFVHLYRKDSLKEQQDAPTSSATVPAPTPPTKTSPWLTRLTESSPSIAAPTPVPEASPAPVQLTASGDGNEGMGDESRNEDNLDLNEGWAEDDDLVLDDIEEETKVVSNISEGRTVTDSRDVPPPEADKLAISVQSTKAAEDTSKANKISKDADGMPQCYSPEDDIIATRKRWVNPRPGFRQLKPMLS